MAQKVIFLYPLTPSVIVRQHTNSDRRIPTNQTIYAKRQHHSDYLVELRQCVIRSALIAILS